MYSEKNIPQMKKSIYTVLLLVAVAITCQAQKKDWAGCSRYEQANADMTKAPAVVFMGNSITEGWAAKHPEFFSANNYAGRGISGQVSSQMLCRFRDDVIDLHPKAVVILAGTNDIALNNGPISVEHIFRNIVSMVELSRANKIKAVLCSVLPVKKYGWRKEVDPVQPIKELNEMLEKYAKEEKLPWVDFYTPMVTDDGALNPAYTQDGVHPTAAGYEVMEAIIAPVLKKFK